MNSVAIIMSAIISFGVTAALGMLLIPFLRRLKFGQTILDIGPSWHKNKQGTPTMGGIMFIAGVTLAVVTVYFTVKLSNPGAAFSAGEGMRLWAGMMMALAYGAVGFLDDYVKVVKRRNLGLTARQKLLMQIIICAFYLTMLWISGSRSTAVTLPFFGAVELGLFYYPLAFFVIIGFVNAVNLTDGIDGLASSVTFVYAVVMLAVAGLLRFSSAGLLSAALAGGCLGFLVWNFHPAKVFMGDTGSMFLGGIVAALAFDVGLPMLLILTGAIYWCEAFSVILQVISYKTTGKRIFKMSPIHHHFEMSGWSENKIVTVFSAAGLLGGVAAIMWVMSL